MKDLPVPKYLNLAIRTFLGFALLLSACSQVDTPTSLEPQNVHDNILYSSSPDMSNPKRLDDAGVSGNVYVWFKPDAPVERVRFYLDDVWVDGRTERTAPYALSGDSGGKLRALDTSTLSAGQHKVVASAQFKDGNTVKWRAYFEVKRGTPEPAPSDALWVGDHEEGNLSDWYGRGGGGKFNSGGGTSNVSDKFAHTGRYSAELTLKNVTATQGVRLFRWAEPRSQSELYYSTWYYFSKRHTAPDWWNIWQYKSKTSSKNDPFFLLDVSDTNRLRLYDWQEKHGYQPLTDEAIPVGRWFQVEVFYKSRGDKTGAITVWQDGVKLYEVKNVRTRYADGDTQWSVNNYTDSVSPNDMVNIYVDDAVISKTRVGR